MPVLTNIRTLYTMNGPGHDPCGAIDDAAIWWRDGEIQWVGKAAELPREASSEHTEDADGAIVLPGLIDCHTHLVFAGDRAHDFAARANGKTYTEIMQAGGGIQTTVAATRAASDDELLALARPRLEQMFARGVTTAECKSGYGLSLDDELRILRVIAKLNHEGPLRLVPTCLAAHVVPKEYAARADEYVDIICNELLPVVAREKLATACDVFVEKSAFTVAQARRIAKAAQAQGLGVRLHAEQLSHSGGALLAAEIGAWSVSHLEHASDADLAAMANADVVAEMLPISQEFLGTDVMVDGRKWKAAGLTIAVGTDFNPGSSMSNDLQLAARLAVTRGKLSCDDVLLGVTKNSAKALRLNDVGTLEAGKRADMVLMDCESTAHFLYDWTRNPVTRVLGKQ